MTGKKIHFSHNTKEFENKKFHSSFKCPDDYRTCKYWTDKLDPLYHCNQDIRPGICIQEYFDDYNKSEVITKDGDPSRCYTRRL